MLIINRLRLGLRLRAAHQRIQKRATDDIGPRADQSAFARAAAGSARGDGARARAEKARFQDFLIRIFLRRIISGLLLHILYPLRLHLLISALGLNGIRALNILRLLLNVLRLLLNVLGLRL